MTGAYMKCKTGLKRVNPLIPGGNRRSYIVKQLLVCLNTYDLLLPPGIKELIAVTHKVTMQSNLQILITRSSTHIQIRLNFFK